jgi:uncharacterized protein
MSPTELARSLTGPPDVDLPTVRFVQSIRDVERSAWDACFPEEIEGYDYHLALETAGLSGFQFGWYVAHQNGLLVCTVPVFFTAYDLATTAQGVLRRAMCAIQPFVPGRLKLQLSCLGSPQTESCPLGFHLSLDALDRETVLMHILSFWSDHGCKRGVGLFGIKDISDNDRERYAAPIEGHGFRSVTSLPTARMPIDFTTIDAYLAGLSRATRKDLRRKLKCRPNVEVEFRNDPGQYLDQIMDMYRDTRSRSDWTFEDIPAAYFSEVLSRMPEQALLALYHHDGQLTAANLLLLDGIQLVDKFFVMRTFEGRRLNLYFLSWIVNIELCLAKGLKVYQSGQASYETKLRLGSRLTRNWIYFRHRNPALNQLLRAVSPWLAIEEPTDVRSQQVAHP